MASIGGVLAGLSAAGRTYRPAKSEVFGKFDCEVQLDQVTLRPYGDLTGRVVVSTQTDIRCYGIRVQLDATINLRFDTKVDNRLSSHKKLEGILQGSEEPGFGYYIYSPVMQQLCDSEDEENNHQKRDHVMIIHPGTYTYPFKLRMTGEPLPQAFRSQYGNLHYKVVVYMRSSMYTCKCYVQVAEKPLRFRGYNNLSEIPNYLEPLKHQSGFNKSMFSSKKIITAVLSLERQGFLPGEQMQVSLNISNPKCFTVKQISVNFVRRVIYNINGATKTTLVNLDSFEDNEVKKEEEIYCCAKLKVPQNCMPTYNVKPVYSVIHLIQYQVKVESYGHMKGQVEVVVGTTKDSVDVLMSRRMSTLYVEDPLTPSGPRSRSGSISSRLSDTSIMTNISLPPAYSQLSSRAVSMLSLNTLPPHYDDLS